MAHIRLPALSFLVFTLLSPSTAPAAEVQAQAMTAPLAAGGACAGVPWLAHGLDAYTPSGCETNAWVEERIGRVGTTDRTLGGRRQVATFRVAPNMQRMTGPAVQHAFLEALKSIDATILTAEDDQDRLIATQTNSAGEFWFVFLPLEGSSDARTSYALTTWMITPLPQEVQAQPLTGRPSTDAPCGDPP